MTIKQKTKHVDIEGGSRIEVRRMKWKATRDFLKQLGIVLAKLFQDAAAAGKNTTEMAVDAAGKLPELIAGSDELVMLLVTSSTNLSAEDLDNLDTNVAAAVIAAALEVNLDDEVKKSLAEAGKVISGLLPAQNPLTAAGNPTRTQ